MFSSARDILWNGEFFATTVHYVFRSAIDCNLHEGPKLVFEKPSWMSREFRLRAADDPSTIFCTAERRGFWGGRWELDLTLGKARLKSMGMFRGGFFVVSEGKTWGRVESRGVFKSGWIVTGKSALDPTDLLLIGLVFSHIQRMRASAAAG